MYLTICFGSQILNLAYVSLTIEPESFSLLSITDIRIVRAFVKNKAFPIFYATEINAKPHCPSLREIIHRHGFVTTIPVVEPLFSFLCYLCYRITFILRPGNVSF